MKCRLMFRFALEAAKDAFVVPSFYFQKNFLFLT